MKAILIDFDGTLANSIPFLYNLYISFLAERGKEGNLKEFQELNGPKLEHFIQTLHKRYQLEENVDEMIQAYKERLETRFAEEVLPFPDAVGMIHKWDWEGRQLGIVTAAHLDLVELFLDKHLDKIPFIITTGEEVPRSKPDPAIYRLALEKFGLKPTEALALEDSPNGIKASQGAGILTFPFKESWTAVKTWIDKHG